MNVSNAPFGEKRYMTVNGQRMAYIDEGEGDAIVFAHRNPTSSYLWRNIMPACQGLGRLIACDLGVDRSIEAPSRNDPGDLPVCESVQRRELSRRPGPSGIATG